jgi:hypothetical protein
MNMMGIVFVFDLLGISNPFHLVPMFSKNLAV